MKVVILSHLFPNWSEPHRGSFVADQAHALARYCDVSVVSGCYEGDDHSEHLDELPVRYLRLPWPRLPSQLALLAAAVVYERKVLAWLRSGGRHPDIIHAHYGFPDAVVGCRVSKALGIPCVVTLHGTDANVQLELPVVGTLMARALSSAAQIICVSEAMRVQVAASHPNLAPLLVSVPNGYDSRDIRFEPHKDPEYLLFVGSLLPVKNPHTLVSAYACIASQTPLDLALAGAGPLEHELRLLAEQLGVSDRVRFLGQVEHREVANYLRRAKALVLPSQREGMPIVVVEALATGTPVVASAVGGIPELVTDASLGSLVPAGDVQALAAAMLEAAQRRWDERQIAMSAPVLSWYENARRVHELYVQAAHGEQHEHARDAHRLVYLTLQSTEEGQAAYAHVNGVVTGLRARGWEVDLFQPEYNGKSPGALGRLAEFWRVQRRLLNRLDGAAAIYCRAHFAAFPSALAASQKGIPALQEVNGTWEDMFIAWPWTRRLGSLFIALEKAQWRRAAALVTVTPPLARWASAQAGGVPSKVIPNAADISRFSPQGPIAGNLPARYVVFVGALAGWQGIPTLLQAVDDPAWPEGVWLVIVGDGAERPAVEAAVERGARVKYLGKLAQRAIPAILRGAIASVSPQNSGHGRSDTGLSPVKVYESLACNTPVIVTNFPGQCELIETARCGVVVPPEDAAAIARAVGELAADPARSARMGERGGEVVRRWHSWDARAAETDRLLDAVTTRFGDPQLGSMAVMTGVDNEK